jgi:hypothetical protein
MWLLSEAHSRSESQRNKVAHVQKRLVPAMLNLFAVADVQIFKGLPVVYLLIAHFLALPAYSCERTTAKSGAWLEPLSECAARKPNSFAVPRSFGNHATRTFDGLDTRET